MDIFKYPDHTFGFKEFHRDPEDAGRWTLVRDYLMRATLRRPLGVAVSRRGGMLPSAAISMHEGAMMPAKTYLFPCLNDNYGVLLHDPESGATAAIDAPESGAVEAALKVTGWKLTDILVTHHHADHTDGIRALNERHGCRVVAPHHEAARIPLVDVTVQEGDSAKVGGITTRVIETPGHTAGHISYFSQTDKLAFVGDTLFSIGCGRVIEGTPEMMWNSLLKLRALPDDTQIYCGHEYTEANIRFARTIEPDNPALAARAEQVSQQIKRCMAS